MRELGRQFREYVLRRVRTRRLERSNPFRAVDASWTCPGVGRPHPVSLVHAEHLHSPLDDEIDIHRCRICGRAYLCEQSEMNDWGSGGGDYCNVTRIWIPLEEGEVRAARVDSRFKPRSAVTFRNESGWRPEG